MHAEVLLHMLRKGTLEGIYTQKPEHGPLVTFPEYMVSYFRNELLRIFGLHVYNHAFNKGF